MKPLCMKTKLSPDEFLAALRAHTEIRPFQGCTKECLFRGKIGWREHSFSVESLDRGIRWGCFRAIYRGAVTECGDGSVVTVTVCRKWQDLVFLLDAELLTLAVFLAEDSSLRLTLEGCGLIFALAFAAYHAFFQNDLKETRIELHRIWYAEDV